MTKSHSLIIGASIVIGCLIMSLQHGNPATGQPPQLPQAQYQITAAHSGSGEVKVYFLETNTGRIWTRVEGTTYDGVWKSLESPVK
jgi:hypothetical protein